MKKWNLIVDASKCINSNNCLLSALDEYVDNDFPGYSKPIPALGVRPFDILKKERGQAPMVDVTYVPTTCMHCDDAPCIAAAENGAVQKRDDGIVMIDPDKAQGQRDLVDACPYGAIWWNEEQNVPQQWIFDAHLLDQGWEVPRPVQSCPTGALRAVKVDDEEMASIREAEGLEDLRPDLATRPRVHYKGLERFRSGFIGGSVAVETGGVVDCVESAEVVLTKDATQIATATTDAFGEFKFDQLEESSGHFSIEANHPEFGSASSAGEFGTSQFLGVLMLDKAADGSGGR